MRPRPYQQNNQQKRTRVNDMIRVSPVRVVQEGKQLGVLSTDVALRLAREAGLDLVEIAPHVRPPVCHIMDFGKFKYEQTIKEKEKKQNSKANELKEIRLTPSIAQHDIEVKANAAMRFLEQKKSVQLNLKYSNREMAHKDEGFRVIERFLDLIKAVGKAAEKPKLQGRNLNCRIEPVA